MRRHTSDPVAHRPHGAWHRGLAARPFTAPRVHKDCGGRVRAGRTERAVNLLLTVHCSGALAVSGAAKDSPTLQEMGGLGVLQMEGGVVEMPLLEPGGAREAGGRQRPSRRAPRKRCVRPAPAPPLPSPRLDRTGRARARPFC